MNISVTSLKKLFIRILHRYHIIIFVITVLGGLAIMVFLLNAIIIRSSQPETVQAGPRGFDQTTIKRIEELKTSKERGSSIDFSKGRTNPFVE